MTGNRRIAEWIFRRVGQRGELKPYALAVSLGLHFVPVNERGSRLIGDRIEYDDRATDARQRVQVMRECARAVLRYHGAADDDRASLHLATLLSAATLTALALVPVASSLVLGTVVPAGNLLRRPSAPRSVPRIP